MWVKTNQPPKQGDTVRIKSGGGPVMSVGCRIGDAHWCSWWDDKIQGFRTEMVYLSQVEAVVEAKDGI